MRAKLHNLLLCLVLLVGLSWMWQISYAGLAEAAWCTIFTTCTGSGNKAGSADWTTARQAGQNVTKCAVIENLAAADDNFELWMPDVAITITSIGLHCRGTCTTGADISLEDRSGNAMTHTVPTHSTGTSNTTFQTVSAANALVVGEGLAFDVDNAVSPETDVYTICFTFAVD